MLAIGTEPSGLRCSYRWGINNGDGLDDLLLVLLRAGSVEVTDDRRHTGLVAHGGCEVDGLLGVILGEPVRQLESDTDDNFPNKQSQSWVAKTGCTYDLTFPR